MSQILKQGISVNAHNRHCRNRQERKGQDRNADGHRQRNPFYFRISCKNDQKDGYNRISGLHHTAEQLSGIRVIGRYGIDIAVFFFFYVSHLPIL